MLSIGVMTIFDCDNYGAELQAVALILSLNKMGCRSELIDYPFYKSPRFKMDSASLPILPLSLISSLKEKGMTFFRKCESVFYSTISQRRRARFDKFRHSVSYSSLYKNFSELAENPPRYDVYLTGSDQVWNPRMGATLRPYFLDFLSENAKRIAYAASFGVSSIPQTYQSFYKKWLSKYSAIGCREQSGCECVISLVNNKPVEHVVDPTLLMDSEDWLQIQNKISQVENSKYILVYELVKAPKLWPFVKHIARERNLKIVRLCGKIGDQRIPGTIHIQDAGPWEFLNLFAHAEAIVTTSFHGTVFSLQFQKDFYSVIPMGMTNAGRQQELLQDLKLTDRLISENSCNDIVFESIPSAKWEDVKSRLEEKRQNSIDFLKKAIDL